MQWISATVNTVTEATTIANYVIDISMGGPKDGVCARRSMRSTGGRAAKCFVNRTRGYCQYHVLGHWSGCFKLSVGFIIRRD